MTTEREIFENRVAWCAAMRDPANLKGRHYLTHITDTGRKDCCLGLACKTLGVKQKKDLMPIGLFLRYGNEESFRYLPREGCVALNLTCGGNLTQEGVKIAKIFSDSNDANCLAEFNDDVYSKDINLQGMGRLIERLFEEEYLFGVITLEPYQY